MKPDKIVPTTTTANIKKQRSDDDKTEKEKLIDLLKTFTPSEMIDFCRMIRENGDKI